MNWAPCLFSANSSLNLGKCMLWNPPLIRRLDDQHQSLAINSHWAPDLFIKKEISGVSLNSCLANGDRGHGIYLNTRIFTISFLAVAVVHSYWLGQNTSCNSWAMHTRIRGKVAYLDIKRFLLSVKNNVRQRSNTSQSPHHSSRNEFEKVGGMQ